MDIELLKQALGALGGVLSVLKQVKELLPDGSKKDDIDEALKQAERQLRLAESQVAQGLGYELCKNHFPPEIMLSVDDTHWKCPRCDNEKDTGPAGEIVSFGPSRRKGLFHM